jgi:hypothetical protein
MMRTTSAKRSDPRSLLVRMTAPSPLERCAIMPPREAYGELLEPNPAWVARRVEIRRKAEPAIAGIVMKP